MTEVPSVPLKEIEPGSTPDLVGLQGRILLHEYDVDVEISDIQPTSFDAFDPVALAKTIGQVSHEDRVAEQTKRNDAGEAWDKDVWAAEVVRKVQKAKAFFDSPKGKPWVAALVNIGIDINTFDQSSALALYDTYALVEDESQGEGIKKFYEKIAASYTNIEDLNQHMAAFQWLGGMFGADAAEITTQAILAIKKRETDPDKLVDSLKDHSEGKPRINLLSDREKQLLERMQKASEPKVEPDLDEDDVEITPIVEKYTDRHRIVFTDTKGNKWEINPLTATPEELSKLSETFKAQGNKLWRTIRTKMKETGPTEIVRDGKPYDEYTYSTIEGIPAISISFETGAGSVDRSWFGTSGFQQLLSKDGLGIPVTFSIRGAHARTLLGFKDIDGEKQMVVYDPMRQGLYTEKIDGYISYEEYKKKNPDGNYSRYLHLLIPDQFTVTTHSGTHELTDYDLLLPASVEQALSPKIQDDAENCIPLAFYAGVQRYLLQPGGDPDKKKQVHDEFQRIFDIDLMMLQEKPKKPEPKKESERVFPEHPKGLTNEMLKTPGTIRPGMILRTKNHGLIYITGESTNASGARTLHFTAPGANGSFTENALIAQASIPTEDELTFPMTDSLSEIHILAKRMRIKHGDGTTYSIDRIVSDKDGKILAVLRHSDGSELRIEPNELLRRLNDSASGWSTESIWDIGKDIPAKYLDTLPTGTISDEELIGVIVMQRDGKKLDEPAKQAKIVRIGSRKGKRVVNLLKEDGSRTTVDYDQFISKLRTEGSPWKLAEASKEKPKVETVTRATETIGTVAGSLKDLQDFARRKVIETRETYEQSLTRALEKLEGTSGIVELHDRPTIVIPDIHARRFFLANVMSQKVDLKDGAGEQTVYDLLKAGRINVVCVGDGVHSEQPAHWTPSSRQHTLDEEGELVKLDDDSELKKAKERKIEILKHIYTTSPEIFEIDEPIPKPLTEKEFSEYTAGGYTYPELIEIAKRSRNDELKDLVEKLKQLEYDAKLRLLNEEMMRGLGTMKMIMDLKSEFPDGFHFLLGNHDRIDLPYEKFGVNQTTLYINWMRKFFGEDFLATVTRYDESLPILAKGTIDGKPLVVSHSAPRDGVDLEYIETKAKQSRDAFTRGDNTTMEVSTLGSNVRSVLTAIGQPDKDTVWVIGHRPVNKGNFRSQLGGQLIQINDQQGQVIALIRGPDFDPERDVVRIK